MNRIVLSFCAVLFFITNSQAQNDNIGSGKNESTLIEFLRTNYTPTSPKDYDEARDSMYQHLDVDESDSLTGVYSGLRAKADGSRTPANGSQSFNTEHSWPQSFYDGGEPMRGDIHHLYPVWSSANSSRNNHPFGEVDDNTTTSWWYWKNGGKEESIPTVDIDLYSEYGNSTFEPREDHKGNAARAMFYFWTMYQNNTDIVNDDFDNVAFFNGMKETLYQWHKQDPVDAAEIERSNGIESIQGNKNPFIHDTTLVRRAYFYEEPVVEETLPDVFISEVYEAYGGAVKYIELFNTSDSDIDFTTNDWAIQRFSNANESGNEVTMSLTGIIKAKDFYVIGDDNSTNGVQTIFGEGLVDQSEGGINHNGNDKYKLVKQASSSPQVIDAFAGDNIGNSSTFAAEQVAYRIFSELPNDGDFGQTSSSINGSTVASGYWKVFDVSSNNSNAKLIATPGYSKGIESSEPAQAIITGSEGWRLFSIPSNTPTLSQVSDDIAFQGISDNNNSNIFTYNSSGSYSVPSSLNTTLNKGEGLAAYFFDNSNAGSSELPIVLDLESGQNSPTSDVSVALNTNTEKDSSYFTLVGNPFQSNFDANSISADASIQVNIHLLQNGLYQAESKNSSILLPWQGFWIESPNTDPSSTVTFPIDGKTESDATLSAYTKQVVENSMAQFNLRSNKTYDKGCRIVLNADANRGWDKYDASKLTPTISDYAILSCIDGDKAKSVHSLENDLRSDYEIPLSIESYNVDDELELDWQISSELLKNITLFDTATGTYISLSEKGSYSFVQNSVTAKNKPINLPFSINPVKSNTESSSSRFIVSLSSENIVSNEEENSNLDKFELTQNFPNPFNPTTQIRYSLNTTSHVKLTVFSATGQQIALLVDSRQSKGTKTIEWNASNLASGIYYARLQSDGVSKTIKMTLLK